ncbi:ornithine carbamoyltransferase [Candidatus Velamenicoccus archaeovorus]|uniref:Ornithine carbamoyltransferase n=1 Tax=Velamenicoccus archaeovorus TaxID=1930593 RepID=A0A410P4Z7_VELA1|nr:ornithine carbamoyltransferase [Candidatus Velamenicoccus archaeovorus]QAT17192.1 ornithine carbamoyltransferase [Candidatus Velamenicoccus archaeovorus]
MSAFNPEKIDLRIPHSGGSKRDFLAVTDFSAEEVLEVFKKTEELKKDRFRECFKNKAVGLIFQKPSLRTRVSFQVGVWQLGGQCMSLSPAEVNIGVRESVKDAAQTLSRYLDLVVARVFKHKDVVDLARYAHIPVINGLSDLHHPCQALADIFTVKEKRGALKGLTLTYVGDGNNVCHSLLQITSLMGMHMRVAAPKGFAPQKDVLNEVQALAKNAGSSIVVTQDPKEAARGTDVLYTDVWASMGQEREAARRARIFKKYQINKELLALAKKDALVMHCLPAHRGSEITDEVMDSSNSVVFDEAENRLHVQKAIMMKLLNK